MGEKFIHDFGLIISDRTPDTIYARGTDSPHHVYILHKGAADCRAGAFHMHSLDGTERLQHVSFEVQNFDDVMIGHDHLLADKTYKHVWGIGRHRLGGQIYDYWKDPWGRIHEHWADSDLLNTEYEATIQKPDGARDYWGPNQQPPIGYAIQNWNLTTLASIGKLILGAMKANRAKD